MKAICYSRVLGKHKTRIPNGQPIQIGTVVFDDAVTSPATAIAAKAHLQFGIVPHLPHWSVIATYDVIPLAIERHRLGYQRVYVMRYDGETAMRKHLGIDDSVLDSFAAGCWYLQPAADIGQSSGQ